MRRRFELHILPTLGSKLVSAVELKDVARLLRELRHGKGLSAEANRFRSSLSALFAWAMAQGERRDNPVLATERAREPSLEREKAGTVRVLDLAERAAIWQAAEADPSVNVSALVRLLVLVPLRREEWTRARWEEIERGEDGRWTLRLPAARMKGKRPHAVPLPAAAKAILEQVASAHGRERTSGFIFSTDGKAFYAGWKRAAARLTRAAALSAPWVIHDLRRGAATQMGEVGIRENIIRRILAHSPRSMLGVTATYERSERLDEMRDALERWAGTLEAHCGAQANRSERVIALPIIA
jgi:integrase